MRIVSNTTWFDGAAIGGKPVESIRCERGRLGLLRTLWRGISADAVVINESRRDMVAFCLLRMFTGRPRRIIANDQIFQPAQQTTRLRIRTWRRLLREVTHFTFPFRETTELARVYGLSPSRISYVPFKVNRLDSVRSYQTHDGGYILSCGRSRRDYTTFCAAVESLNTKAVILAPPDNETRAHGTDSDLTNLPGNVELVHDDGSWESWLRWIGGATVVVVPILPPTLAASGIGTYLVAMALGKCVVITDSLASQGMLTDEEAIIVPPRNVEAMRAAIQSALEDPALRSRVAEAGRAYALSLGDESRLARDMIDVVSRIVETT